MIGREVGVRVPEQRIDAWASLRNRIENLRNQSRQTEDSGERRVARRVLGQLFIGSFETAAALHLKRDYAPASVLLEVAAEVRPDSAGVFLSLARTYAADGRNKKAIEMVKRSVQNGFCNVTHLETEADFNLLRGEKEYKRIVEELTARCGSATVITAL